MAQLADILYGVNLTGVSGSTWIEVNQICSDSRKVEPGCVFVAVRGTQTDGHAHIPAALEKGAIAIVAEEEPQTEQSAHTTWVTVQNSAKALGCMASNFYGKPSEKIKLVGFTGTNGKTTCATLSYRLFRSLGYKCGLLSTIVNLIDDHEIPATHTTPDAIELNRLLSIMVEQGCSYCFMEVSSHALDQHRVEGQQFFGAVFTNISHDHLDYHKTFQDYIHAKKRLFDMLPQNAFALLNLDDRRAGVMIQNTKAKSRTYSLHSDSDFKAKILENTFEGLLLSIDGHELFSRLVGEFNAYNLLAVYGVASLSGENTIEILRHLSRLHPAEGRFDHFISSNDRITGIVDYAHTPDALKKILETIAHIRTRNEQVITIIGCGGNRDKAKRPEMARIACEWSDKVILTSDNPRNEDPIDILKDMQKGVPPLHYKKVLIISDRKEAIRTACSFAGKKDILLVAGKGHEKYQEINGIKHPFDDKAILIETLKELHR